MLNSPLNRVNFNSLTRAGAIAWIVLRDCPPGAAPTAVCPTRMAQTTATGTLADQHSVPVAGIGLVGAPTSTVAVFANPEGKTRAQLVTTVDAGRTWSRHPDPCAFGGGALVGTDARQWWLLCEQDYGMGHAIVDVYETTDAGVTWIQKASTNLHGQSTGGLGAGVSQGVAISPDGRRLWLIGIDGLQTSTDGGQTWTNIPNVDLGGAFARLDTVSPERAWISAADQGLWVTADGSRWTALGATGLPNSRAP
ncbi:MAG TPA: hypothetical protein VFG00_06695 [Acidothermaceae bacterium]|nr:hypothetical protein [Acidothermaceae bacterium]